MKNNKRNTEVVTMTQAQINVLTFAIWVSFIVTPAVVLYNILM